MRRTSGGRLQGSTTYVENAESFRPARSPDIFQWLMTLPNALEPPFATMDPDALLAWLLSDREIALLDVREARAFVAKHMNLARMTPLSSLELDVTALVPRLGTKVVLVDDGAPGGPAPRAAALLQRLGYHDVQVLAGGLGAWQAAGLPVVDGYSTLLKAFGDRVRRHRQVAAVDGTALRARQDAGVATTLVDARPADEYAYLALPGTANHAGTELALRAWPVDASATPWIVNCFSRTRGIIGTATLRLLGHPDARFLEDGVMRWALEGRPVVENAQPEPELPEASAEETRRRADALIARHALPVIDGHALQRLRSATERTLYVFDLRLRPPDDGALPGVRAVPGGQLLMHFEHLIGTRNARIVLLDAPHRLRAAITAFWLVQLGQAEVFILDGDLPQPWSSGERRDDVAPASEAASIAPGELAALLGDAAGRVDVVDVGPSEDFERHHLPGAYYLLPYTMEPLEPLAAPTPERRHLVFTSPDGRAARVVARDAIARWPGCDVRWLAGGTRAWRDAGLPTERIWQADRLLTPFEDDWGSVMRVSDDRRGGVWADYLQWERTLEARVAADPTVVFRLF